MIRHISQGRRYDEQPFRSRARQAAQKDTLSLRHHRFFADAPEHVIASCAEYFVRRSCPKGTVLYAQGDRIAGIYLLRSGKVRLGRGTADGEDFAVAILGPGDMIGEDAVFSRRRTRATRACAVEDAVLYFISVHDLDRALARFPALAVNIGRYLQDRSDDALATLEDLSLRNVSTRILRLLQRLGHAHGVVHEAGVRVNVRLTHANIASLIGSSRETVCLEMGQLVNSGLVRRENGYFIVESSAECGDLCIHQRAQSSS